MSFLFHEKSEGKNSSAPKDFEYLSQGAIYLDSACQTLRPVPVIKAQEDYFKNFNACGGRVKYEWGRKVDEITLQAKAKLLEYTGLSQNDYAVSFTLNTTYGINLVLMQLPAGRFKRIVVSEVEHNSVFLPSIAFSKRVGVERLVLPRDEDGSLLYNKQDLEKAVVLLNTTSNIDGRSLVNLNKIVTDTHARGGVVVLDAAQSMASYPEFLKGVDFDCLIGSSHKMYGPSLGFIIIKKDLLKALEPNFIGGGTANDVYKDSFELMTDDYLSEILEPGLQNFSGIVGFNTALDWIGTYKPEGMERHEHQSQLAQIYFDALSQIEDIKMINREPSTVLNFYTQKVDGHKLAIYLSQQNIMARSGYYCCHYYLKHLKDYPPLLRISLGLHNTKAEATHALDTIKKLVHNL
jgi:selenocysteine lyase/cysteine desulfurase